MSGQGFGSGVQPLKQSRHILHTSLVLKTVCRIETMQNIPHMVLDRHKMLSKLLLKWRNLKWLASVWNIYIRKKRTLNSQHNSARKKCLHYEGHVRTLLTSETRFVSILGCKLTSHKGKLVPLAYFTHLLIFFQYILEFIQQVINKYEPFDSLVSVLRVEKDNVLSFFPHFV